MTVALGEEAVAVYIHWPFCVSKCPYCDFNSHVANQKVTLEQWIAAYEVEIDYFFSLTPKNKVRSIYFGGGTPSLMDTRLVAAILTRLRSVADLREDIEITLEANPHSVEWKKFGAFKAAGVNRVSLGVQALREDDLRFFGRAHKVDDALNAVRTAQEIFGNYSFDLIYGRPMQTLDLWREELLEALALAGGHLSLYQLTIEKGTPFYQSYQRGEFTLPDEELLAQMYELTEGLMLEHGYHAYEVSNYACKGKESQHNLCYWRYDDYIGIGAGAHGRFVDANGVRWASMTQHAPYKWLEKNQQQGNAIQSLNPVDDKDAIVEMLMMSLRLKEGVNKQQFFERFGKHVKDCISKQGYAMLQKEGLIVENELHIALSFAGRMVANSVLGYLL